MLRCGQGWSLNRKLPVTAKLRDAVSSTGMVISPGGGLYFRPPPGHALTNPLREAADCFWLSRLPGQPGKRLFKPTDFILLKR